MADLKSLIRLRKHEVDEKQKILSELYRQIEALENRKNSLLEKLAHERAALEENLTLETREFYGRFEGAIRNDVERLDGEIAKLEVGLEKAQEDVRAAFEEQKRVEIVHDRRQEEERQAMSDKEASELDAIGIEGFRRREEN